MTKKLLLFLASSVLGFSQLLYVNVTAGGSYNTAPTVTASGGGCSAEPTFGTAVLATGTLPQPVASVPPTFAGTGCTSAPTLTFSAGAATATAVMLTATIAILNTPIVVSDQNPEVSIAGTNILYHYECTLIVPALFVPLYAVGNINPMPNTSQTSQVNWSIISGAAALQPFYNRAFAGGTLTIYDGTVNVNSATALSVVEATVVLNCAQWQTDLNAWNPWLNYGTYYNGTWHSIGIP